MLNGLGAVILAGGKSSRMGCDKAFLELDGRTLLSRQIALLRDAGLREIFIAGRTDVDYSAFDCPVVVDRIAEFGPLAGIESALHAVAAPLLLVLAVDMPQMNASQLNQLAAQCRDNLGAIPRVNGAIEPLAAIYPKAALGIVIELLNGTLSLTPTLSRWEREQHRSAPGDSIGRPARSAATTRETRPTIPPLPAGEGRGEGERHATTRSARTFAERCVAAGLAAFIDLPTTAARHFANWNSPSDVPCLK